MKISVILKFFLLVSLAYNAQAYGGVRPRVSDTDVPLARQNEFAPIILQGRTLTGPNSAARRQNGRILIPVSAVARALSDIAGINVNARTVSIRRQSGIIAEFDARIGQVRENGAAILTVSNTAEIVFTPNIEDLLLPLEIAAALFDSSISFDAGRNAVLVTRGVIGKEPTSSEIGRPVADLYQVDYEYNLNRYGSASSHNLVLTAAGRLGDGRYYFTANSSNSPSKKIAVRNSTFALERPNGQKYVAGDFGTGGNLQFLSANIRGGSATIPVSDVAVTAFAGRSYSGTSVPAFSGEDILQPVREPIGYDTNVFGVFATTNSVSTARRTNALNFSAGAMRFASSNRGGDLVTGSINFNDPRFTVQGDFGYGRFSGFRPDGSRFDGSGAAVDVAGTFQVTGDLAVQGRFTKIGKNFLSPQSGVREPLDLKAAGLTWSPTKWLSTSLSASTAGRPGDAMHNNNFATAAFAVTPGAGLPRFYVSHTAGSTSQIRSSAFTLLNASKEFSRLRLFLNATRIKNLGPASMNAQLGASYAISDTNSIEVSQGIASRRSLNGQFDWRTSNLLNRRLSLSAGVGYSHSKTSGFAAYERVSASLNLPRQTSLQVNYLHTNARPTMLVTLRGSLFRKREASAFLDSGVTEMNSYGKVSGRVYQDIDQDGRFDPAVDKPQADVKVRVDGNRYVVSDENGLYKLDSIMAGDHKIYLDLLSVRADLTLLDESAQNTKLRAGHQSNNDFRLVRTGRISGRVWLDANENGKLDASETSLADIRVVTATGRDTLTDADGYFTIGDLPPGEHTFLIDEKTLPEKTMPGVKPIAVQAFAGRETSDVMLCVVRIPAEVKKFPAKPPIKLS